MKDENISRAYAQALYQLGKEKGVDVAKEITDINESIRLCSDLENLIFLEIFTPEEKLNVVNEVMNRLEVSEVVKKFVQFLIQEKRVNLIPLIYKDLVVIDDHEKGFLRGVVEGGDETITEEFKQRIESFLKSELENKNINLQYSKTNQVTAGYKITVDDLQVDASLESQLNDLKHKVLNS